MNGDVMLAAPGLVRQRFYTSPDPARVLMLPFTPAADLQDGGQAGSARLSRLVDRVLALDHGTATRQLAEMCDIFGKRHRNAPERFEARAEQVTGSFPAHAVFTSAQRQLIGAYLMLEYSFESAALFNPSIVLDPDQSGAPDRGCRFILSLRAVGEGHVSSLTFRSGSLAANGEVTLDPAAKLASPAAVRSRRSAAGLVEIELGFDPAHDISERVIFPITETQSNGIEDFRFVEFIDGRTRKFFATYTAYNGRQIRSELIETEDFVTFRMSTLGGAAARNKGMALFPRRIDGRYAMIGRQDAENLYLIFSDDLRSWDEGVLILKPTFPWEVVQVGNCGSPIELDEGWLLFTHGVGPMRNYSIGAVLLDKHDPSKIIARSREPLLRPGPEERKGYVPNVVYSCGAMRHNSHIILPYAIADTFSTFATIKIDTLLATLDGA